MTAVHTYPAGTRSTYHSCATVGACADDAHPGLQRLATLAQRLLMADFCAINVLEDDRQRTIAASPGVPLDISGRLTGLCRRIRHSRPGVDIFVTEDASKDLTLADSPWVNGELGSTRFLAVATLTDSLGDGIGTVCIWSSSPMKPGDGLFGSLKLIRDAVMDILDSRRRAPEHGYPADPGPGSEVGGPMKRSVSSTVAEECWSIRSVIDQQAITTIFQPIVHLESGMVVGFEALTRGPAGSTLASPMALIAEALKQNCLGELDWLCRISAMRAAAASALHPSLSWFINVEPAGLAIDCPVHLRPSLAAAKTGLRVILEIVERDVEGHVTALLHATDQARRDAWGIALDDVGAEEGSLALLPFLRPDVVKLDMSLVQGVPRRAAAAITGAVRSYAERRGAVILAEGIETQEQEELAKVFGATYGQGYLYGRPAPLPASVPAPRHAIPLLQRMSPLAGATPYEVLTAMTATQRSPKKTLLHITRHIEEQCERGTEASVMLAGFQRAEFFTAAKRERFHQLAALNALTVVLASGLESHSERSLQIGPLPAHSNMAREWVMIVINPHHAVAFVARDCGDTEGPDGDRRFDYVYTHSRDAVILAGRSFLEALTDPSREIPTPVEVKSWEAR